MVGAKKVRSNRLMLVVGLAVAMLVSASPAFAQGALTGVIIDFPDSGLVDVKDSEENPVPGQAEHTGTVRCYDGNCGQKTELQFTSTTIEYKFKDLLALDLIAERSVVTGTGVISGEDGKAKFLFTATFQNVEGGSVMISYMASRPDASFTLTAPGTFTLVERP